MGEEDFEISVQPNPMSEMVKDKYTDLAMNDFMNNLIDDVKKQAGGDAHTGNLGAGVAKALGSDLANRISTGGGGGE